MNLSELQEALSRYGFDEEDPLTTWLNAAQYELAMAADWGFLQSVEDVAIAAGQTEVILSSPVAKVEFLSVTLANGKRHTLDFIPYATWLRDVDPQASASNPDEYTLHDNTTLYLSPAADGDYTLRIVYRQKPTALQNPGDIPVFPEDLHYAIVLGAAAIGLKAENEEERAVVARNDFNEWISRAIGATSNRVQGEMATIVDGMGYGY